jgi:hypothetical protein
LIETERSYNAISAFNHIASDKLASICVVVVLVGIAISLCISVTFAASLVVVAFTIIVAVLADTLVAGVRSLYWSAESACRYVVDITATIHVTTVTRWGTVCVVVLIVGAIAKDKGPWFLFVFAGATTVMARTVLFH